MNQQARNDWKQKGNQMNYVLWSVLLLGCSLYIFDNYTIGTKKFVIRDEAIPKSFDGFRILHLSDLHNSTDGKGNETIIRKVNELQPDLIFYTGDMVDRDTYRSDSFISLAKDLAKAYPAYYIMGNHEDDLGLKEKKKLLEEIGNMGIRVLHNERVNLRREDGEISLYALNLEPKYGRNTYHKKTGELSLKKADIETLLGMKKEGFNILLAHNPLYFEAYADYGADLTFSGHLHGGLIRLPFVGGLLSPDRVFNPKYDRGLYMRNGSRIIVSPGMGGRRLRIFNRPMIYLAVLECDTQGESLTV